MFVDKWAQGHRVQVTTPKQEKYTARQKHIHVCRVFGPTSFVLLRSTTAWTVLTFRWAEKCNFGFDKWRCRSWSEDWIQAAAGLSKTLKSKNLAWGRTKQFQLLLLSRKTQLFSPERGQEKLLHKSFSSRFFIRQSRLNNTVLFPQEASRLNTDTATAGFTSLFLRDPQQGPSAGMCSLCLSSMSR